MRDAILLNVCFPWCGWEARLSTSIDKMVGYAKSVLDLVYRNREAAKGSLRG
jgi:hypothetical protein